MLLPLIVIHPVWGLGLCPVHPLKVTKQIFLNPRDPISEYDRFTSLSCEEGLIGDDGSGVFHDGLLELSSLFS